MVFWHRFVEADPELEHISSIERGYIQEEPSREVTTSLIKEKKKYSNASLSVFFASLFVAVAYFSFHPVANSQDTTSIIEVVNVNPDTHISRKLAAENTLVVEKAINVDGNYVSGQTLSLTSLGECYNHKTDQLAKAKIIVPNEKDEDIFIQSPVSRSHVAKDFMSVQDYANDLLEISGSITVQYKMIEIWGEAAFEKEFGTETSSITLIQQGFREIETLELNQNLLQKEGSLTSLDYIHSSARTDEQLKKFIEDHGEYYVTKITKGIRASRKVTFTLASDEDKQLIEAKVGGKINLKALSIEFEAAFKMADETKKKNMAINYVATNIGGDPSKLNNVDFSTKDFTSIEKQILNSWDDFWAYDPKEDSESLDVLSAEVSLISSAIHPAFSRSAAQNAKLYRRTKLARDRMNEIEMQKVLMNLAEVRANTLLSLLPIGHAGAKNELLLPLRTMKASFEDKHLEVVLEKFENYLTSSEGEILAHIPARGSALTNDRTPNVDIKYNKSKGWISEVKLNGPQMSEVFYQLSGASRIESKVNRNNMLVDGTVALGVPAGIPNEVKFYYEDEDVKNLDFNGKNTLYIFKIVGVQWDPFEQKVVKLGVPIARNSNIDFNRLPEWLSKKKYILEDDYSPNHLARKYNGFWRAGKPYDEGLLTNTGGINDDSSTSYVSCDIKWYQGSVYHHAKKLILNFHDTEVVYTGQVKYNETTMNVAMHGRGSLVSSSTNITKGVWEDGKIIVHSLEDWISMNPFLQQEHRHKISSPFELNSFDSHTSVMRYIGEVNVDYTPGKEKKVHFKYQGKGKMEYKDKSVDEGEWNDNKIVIDSKNKFNRLHSFLRENDDRHEFSDSFKIEIDDNKDAIQFIGRPKFENGDFVKDGEGRIEYSNGKTDAGRWNENKIVIENIADFDKLQPYLKHEDRLELSEDYIFTSSAEFDNIEMYRKDKDIYKMSDPFTIEIDDNEDDVIKYVGKIKLDTSSSDLFIKDGEGRIEYSNGKTDAGRWNENRIVIENIADFDKLQPYLKHESRYELSENFLIDDFGNKTVDKYLGKAIYYESSIVMHGEGIIYYKNGKRDEGIWKYGKYHVKKMNDFNKLQPFLRDNPNMYTLDSNLTEAPTNSPTTENQALTRPLIYVGDSASIIKKLQQCEGSCDKDEDCEEDLICFQRKFGGGVPGCGGNPENDRADYCIRKQDQILKTRVSSRRWRVLSVPDHLYNAGTWDIVHLKFYSQIDCSGNIGGGNIINSNHQSCCPPEQAFNTDGKSNWWGGRPDSEGLFWLGKEYDSPKTVGCVALYDLNTHGAKEVRVQAWESSSKSWQNVMIRKDMPAGYTTAFISL